MNRSIVEYKNYDFVNYFFQTCLISVNDVIEFVTTNDSEQLYLSLTQLYVDMLHICYVDGLKNEYVNQ